MKKIKIGNTVALSWEIFIHEGDEKLPYDLTGKDISIYLVNAFDVVKIEEFVTENNVLSFTWEGSEQRYTGVYQMTLVENEGTDTMITFDECEAFELVRCSCSDDEEEETIEKVELSSSLNMVRVYPIVPVVGPNGNWWVDGKDTGKPSTGMSAYEFAKENGYTGTEEEYKLECASVPIFNEESRVATNAAREAAENANDAAATAGTATQKANKAASDATNAAGTANSAAENANDAATRAERAINDLSDVATSGDYNDLKNKPVIPTKLSQLDNDKNYIDEDTFTTTLENDYVLKDDVYAVADGLRDSEDLIFYLPTAAPDDTDRMLLTNGSLKTINGQSIVGSGDITIEGGGSNIYTWLWNGSDAGFISQSEYNAIQNADAVMVSFKGDAIYHAEKIGTMLQFHIILLDEIVTYTFEFSENGDSIQWICTTTSIKNDNTEIKEALDEIVDEEGYLYSNGEKVDMRFTRSLLPVGTSVPANANLNTIPYLRIGKYYCSQNVDAKTVKNCPVNMAFSMEVFNPLGTNVDDETTAEYTYRLRVLTPYDTGIHYTQCCRTSGTPGTWTYDSWYVTPRSKFALASSKNDGSAAIGATNKGVYIDSNGEIKAMSYTVAKSVPSNAVFTDTNTKVTSVGNHYAPAEDEAEQITAPEGEVVTGIKRDAAGHVVGVVSTIQEVGETEYESAIADKELTTPSAVGGIAQGTKVSDLEGKTFAEMFDDLLFPTVNPTFTAPSASIAFKSYSSTQEIGAAGPTSANFTTGYNAGAITLNGTKQANRGGSHIEADSFIYVNGSASNKTLPSTVALGSTTFKYRAAYGEGPQPKNNKGGDYDSPLAAGTVDSSQITLNGTYPWYATTATAGTLTKQSLIAWNATAGKMSTSSNGFEVKPHTAAAPQMFKIPRQVSSIQIYNSFAGKWESDKISNWDESTSSETINGNTRTYYTYTYNGDARGAVKLIVKF